MKISNRGVAFSEKARIISSRCCEIAMTELELIDKRIQRVIIKREYIEHKLFN